MSSMGRPEPGQFGRSVRPDALRTNPEDARLLNELRSLGPNELRWQGGAGAPLSAGEWNLRDLLIDDLTTEHAINRREAEDRARDQSSEAMFGDWQKLDEKGKKEWAKGDKEHADRSDWFWTGIKGLLDTRREILKRQGLDPDEDTLQTGLERRIAGNIELNKHKRAMAEAIERGEIEGPKYADYTRIPLGFGNTVVVPVGRDQVEGVIRGGSQVVSSFLHGVAYASEYASSFATGEQAPMSKGQQAWLYKIGDLTEEWAKARFPEDPVRANEFKKQFAEGAGSMVAFFGPGIAARIIYKAGTMTMSAIAGFIGAGQQTGSMADDAIKAMTEGKTVDGKPVTEDDATAAFLLAFPIGATEALPLAHLFRGHQGQWLKAILVQAFEEGGQEWLQQVLENWTARSYYDDKRQWDDNAWDAAAVGAWAGSRREPLR